MNLELSQEETALVLKINSGLPAEVHQRYRELISKRREERLTQDEYDELLRLTDEADFRPTANVDALLATQNQRVLAVVKKNGSRLRALRRWLEGARKELLAGCPILIIDDEADQASVSTAKPDRLPTTINRPIRLTSRQAIPSSPFGRSKRLSRARGATI